MLLQTAAQPFVKQPCAGKVCSIKLFLSPVCSTFKITRSIHFSKATECYYCTNHLHLSIGNKWMSSRAMIFNAGSLNGDSHRILQKDKIQYLA